MKLNVFHFNERDIFYRMVEIFEVAISLDEFLKDTAAIAAADQRSKWSDGITANVVRINSLLEWYRKVYRHSGIDPDTEDKARGTPYQHIELVGPGRLCDEINLLIINASNADTSSRILAYLLERYAIWDNEGNRDQPLANCRFIPVWNSDDYSQAMDQVEDGETILATNIVTLGQFVDQRSNPFAHLNIGRERRAFECLEKVSQTRP